MRYLGTVIGKSVVIELGPVLTALVVGGRVGASIAAELGTMKVTEQIDALETLAIDPVRYLVAPRLLAGIIMLPVITIFADFIAIMGGYEVALRSAKNFRYLRKKGVRVRKTIDLVIGAFCIHENLILLHDDKDFEPMERYLGLKVLSP